MKFGVRECAEVILRAKARQQIGKRTFYRNEPVIRFDTLTTSSMEGAATTVYAQGGPGNARLLAWEGERTLTFTMEDALISPEGIMILSGAGLIDASANTDLERNDHVLYVHTTSQVKVEAADTIMLPKLACWSHSGEMDDEDTDIEDITEAGIMPGKNYYNDGADIFIMVLNNGEITGEPCIPDENGVQFIKVNVGTLTDPKYEYKTKLTCTGLLPGDVVLVDYYIKRVSGVKQIEITPDKFGGYFYLEASTLFRDEATGRDLPAEFIIPKCKIQSNFTFTMAGSGDPSTFTFTLDAFPDYTKFDLTKKVLAAIQVVETDDSAEEESFEDRRGHTGYTGRTGEAAFSADTHHFKDYGAVDKYDEDYAYADDDYASEGAKAESYTITVTAGANGSASADLSSAKAGRTVTVTAVPSVGYKVATMTGATMSGTGNVRTFTMPSSNVTINVTFEEDE